MRFFAKVDKFMWLRPKTKIIFAGPPFDPLFGPKPDAILKKRQKIAIFSRFLKYLRALCMRYRLGLLIQTKANIATSFRSIL